MASSSTSWPPHPETWLNISPTCQQIHDQLLQFPPKEPGYYEFPSCMIDKSELQIQHEHNHPKIDKLMSALPHFDVSPRHDDISALPWRVLWPVHPVIDTFGHTRYKLPADSPFLYPDDLNTAISDTLPNTLDDLRDYILIEPRSRVVIYHGQGPVRHSCAVFLAARMKGDIAPYFRNLWTRDEKTPLPSTDPGMYATVQTKLHEAYEILLGRGRVMHKSTWDDCKKKHSITTPSTAVPAVTSSPPPPSLHDTAAFPPVAAAVSKAPAHKGRLGPPPKKAASTPVVGSYETQTSASQAVFTTATPSLAPAVPALPLDSPMPEAAPAATVPLAAPSISSVLLAAQEALSSPSAPTVPVPESTGPSPSPGAEAAPDVIMTPALPLKEQVERSGIPIQGAKLTSLRPTLHPPTQSRPRDKTLPAPTVSPPLHHIFAEAFSRLPSVHSFMAGFCRTGRDLYNYLFSGTQPLPPQDEAADDPMGTRPAFDPVAAAHEVTVFSQMVEECIDIPASFADPRRLSAPEIQATENALTTLTIATPFTPSFSGLVQHLYDQLHPYLSKRQTEKTTLAAFVTFVVGPPDHPNARYALHSHLVGCHTTSNNDLHVDYSTIYIPIGLGQPEEWGPLMVFLAAGFLWPDLSFLVCHPRLMLGAHAPLDELSP